MGDLSQYFNRHEFKCKCGRCGQDTVDHELIKVLERLRAVLREPIVISSGNRCYEHNMNSNGSPKSMHLFSKAADIQVKNYSPTDIYEILDEWYPDTYGIGVYNSWVHIDVRPIKARWDKRTPKR